MARVASMVTKCCGPKVVNCMSLAPQPRPAVCSRIARCDLNRPSNWHVVDNCNVHVRHISRRRRQVAIPAAAVEAAAALGLAAPPLSFSQRPQLCDQQGRLLLKNLTLAELEEWCEAIGESSKRAHHLWRLMYQQGRWIRHFSDADGPHRLAASAQLKLNSLASLSGGLSLQSVHTAQDGTHKLVFSLNPDEGEASGSVETVLIPMTNKDGSQPRYTACLSTQVGCAMNCQFCFTGRMGLLGNLSSAQVVEQVVEARRWLHQYQQQQQQVQGAQQQEEVSCADTACSQPQPQQQQQQQQAQAAEADEEGAACATVPESPATAGSSSSGTSTSESTEPSSSSSSSGSSASKWPAVPPRISNIVFMGMGEPLHNMAAVMPALDILADPGGLALSRNKIIVSTVGLVPQLRELRASGKAKLAVSLHATTDEVRSWIVPTNRKYNLELLMSTLAELYPLDGPRLKRDDFVVIEYVLLKGVNDTDEDAQRLLELTQGIYCMINLIVFNPHEGTRFRRSEEEQVKSFRRILVEGGKVCTIRMSKGDDEMAACGQLGDPGLSPRPAPILKAPQSLREALA